MEGNVEVGRSPKESRKKRARAAVAAAAANGDGCDFQSGNCRKYLVSSFPGRTHEIGELLSILGEPADTFPPLLLYGAAATGKTSLAREIMACLQRPFAYVSCRSCYSPRLLFESTINQLIGHVRCKSNSYASANKCERMVDFIYQLVEACSVVSGRKNSNKSAAVSTGGRSRDVIYLLFDDIDLVRGWPGGTSLLSSLVSLSDLTKLPHLGLMFLSNSGPDTFLFGLSSRNVVPVYFRAYTNEELHSILVNWHPSSELYPLFLKTSLPPFSRTSRSLTELCNGLRPLFEMYCEPIVEGNWSPNKCTGSRELFTYMKGHIQQGLSKTYSFSVYDKRSDKTVRQAMKGDAERSSPSSTSGFHLSHCSKFLLLASYIASRNPPTLDDTLFGVGDGTKSGKRTRRSSMSAMEKRDADLQEKRLKGPSNCPLERLMAVYKCVASEGALAMEGGKGLGEDDDSEKSDTNDITSDVLMELATLTSVNLILSSSSNPLEGVTRFRSNVDTDFIHKVARSIKFPLSKYLLHG